MKHPKLERQLTTDEAMAELQILVRDTIGEAPWHNAAPLAPETPEEREASRFRAAEFLIGLACPDRSACADQRCRRDAACRHLVYLRDRQKAGRSQHPRRTAGAEAMRYAAWVFMSAYPAEAETGEALPDAS